MTEGGSIRGPRLLNPSPMDGVSERSTGGLRIVDIAGVLVLYRCFPVGLKLLILPCVSIMVSFHDRQVQFAKGPGPSEKQQTLGKGLDAGEKACWRASLAQAQQEGRNSPGRSLGTSGQALAVIMTNVVLPQRRITRDGCSPPSPLCVLLLPPSGSSSYRQNAVSDGFPWRLAARLVKGRHVACPRTPRGLAGRVGLVWSEDGTDTSAQMAATTLPFRRKSNRRVHGAR